jgi:hypothetical protein
MWENSTTVHEDWGLRGESIGLLINFLYSRSFVIVNVPIFAGHFFCNLRRSKDIRTNGACSFVSASPACGKYTDRSSLACGEDSVPIEACMHVVFGQQCSCAQLRLYRSLDLHFGKGIRGWQVSEPDGD